MIDVIIPTFNEEPIIRLFLRSLKKELNDVSFRVIIVDDSTDNTALIARKACSDLNINARIIERDNKKGKGSAVRRGLKELKADKGVIMDADLEYHPRGIKPMLELLDKCDFVTSVRKKELPWYRRLLSGCFRLLVILLFNIPFDTQSGLKVFKKSAVKDVNLKEDRWVWDVELIHKVLNQGCKVCMYEVTQTQRSKGDSKINFFTPFQMFLNLIKLRIRLYYEE